VSLENILDNVVRGFFRTVNKLIVSGAEEVKRVNKEKLISSGVSNLPINKQRELFDEVFNDLGLISIDGKLPYFECETPLSEFATVYSFSTFIPEREWLVNKELLETYLDIKILSIEQAIDDNRIIHILSQTSPLPISCDWDNDYITELDHCFALGMSNTGIIEMDIEKYPHAFIAGETGSGKSNLLKCLIYQALNKYYEVVLIDFKRGVSFSDFEDYVTIHYEYDDVIKTLKAMVAETSNRLDKFRKAKVDNLNDYIDTTGDFLNRIFIFIDELAELLKTRNREYANALNDSIESLTRLSRAAGIHLIMGIQRPDSTIISGQIKNNVTYRICGKFADKEPSRIMLGSDIASTLPNVKGRFFVKDDRFREIQAFYFNLRPTSVATDSLPLMLDEPPKAVDDVILSEDEKETPTVKEMIFDFSDFKK